MVWLDTNAWAVEDQIIVTSSLVKVVASSKLLFALYFLHVLTKPSKNDHVLAKDVFYKVPVLNL